MESGWSSVIGFDRALVRVLWLVAMKYLGDPQSGSQAGTTASRNRNGQYYRTRAMPVNPSSISQQNVRNRMSTNAASWRTITDNQRAGWSTLGEQMTRVDKLGQSYNLNGFQAYCSVNNNLLATGGTVLTDATGVVVPPVLLTATITLTAAALSVAYTATPLGAAQKLMSYVSPPQSPGRAFNKNYRLLAVSAAAAASPANLFAAFSAKFGVPIVGERVFFRFCIQQAGFVGQPFDVAQVVA